MAAAATVNIDVADDDTDDDEIFEMEKKPLLLADSAGALPGRLASSSASDVNRLASARSGILFASSNTSSSVGAAGGFGTTGEIGCGGRFGGAALRIGCGEGTGVTGDEAVEVARVAISTTTFLTFAPNFSKKSIRY